MPGKRFIESNVEVVRLYGLNSEKDTHLYGDLTVDGALEADFVNRTASAVVAPFGGTGDYVSSPTAAEAKMNQAFIATNAAGGGVNALRAGTYNQSTSGHVLPLSNTIFQGEGKASNIVLAVQKVVKVDQQNNVRLQDFALDATINNTIVDTNVGKNTYAIYIDRSSDVTVERVNIETFAYGIFLTNQTTSTTVSRFRFLDCTIRGACRNDLIGGGPGVAGATVSEIIIDRCFIKQDATMTNAGTYLNAIDIVAQQSSNIMNTITYGGILLGGEKIPHLHTNIVGVTVHAPVGIGSTVAVGQIAVLCASNTDPVQSADSKGINISSFNITSGNLFIQGQSATSNRTQLFNISNGNINVNPSASYADHTYGINLNYVSNGKISNVTVRNGVRGVSLTNANDIDISNCDFTGCTTAIVMSGSNRITGRNNIGINPDCLYAGGNITGATTFTRVNGLVQTFTLTGNVTATVTDGVFIGDILTREFTMGGAGSYIYTKGSNEKIASFTPTAAVGARDTLTQRWNGAHWVEIGRAQNIS